jgi:hypothetical protein
MHAMERTSATIFEAEMLMTLLVSWANVALDLDYDFNARMMGVDTKDLLDLVPKTRNTFPRITGDVDHKVDTVLPWLNPLGILRIIRVEGILKVADIGLHAPTEGIILEIIRTTFIALLTNLRNGLHKFKLGGSPQSGGADLVQAGLREANRETGEREERRTSAARTCIALVSKNFRSVFDGLLGSGHQRDKFNEILAKVLNILTSTLVQRSRK